MKIRMLELAMRSYKSYDSIQSGDLIIVDRELNATALISSPITLYSQERHIDIVYSVYEDIGDTYIDISEDELLKFCGPELLEAAIICGNGRGGHKVLQSNVVDLILRLKAKCSFQERNL